MALTLCDTDHLIDALRGHEPERSRIRELLQVGGIAITTVTAFELLGWARTQADIERIERWLAASAIFDLDIHAARAAAAIQRTLGGAGLTIGPRDTLIAGIAVANGLSLLTRNVSEFERVPGLQLVRLN